MFELLNEDQEVIDAPGALSLDVKRGALEFNNVSFSYVPERIVLKNISFSVSPGRTTALVSFVTIIYNNLGKSFTSKLQLT
jgi:ATP-binding cassette subfamily B (MDR/TAP) protein 6